MTAKEMFERQHPRPKPLSVHFASNQELFTRGLISASPAQLHALALLRAERDRQREAESLRPESGGLAVQEYDPGDVEGSEVVAWLRTVS